MSDLGGAVLKATVARLRSALTMDIHDAVPQGATFPYVTIDATDVASADRLSVTKDRHSIYLSVWSIKKDRSEVIDALSAIYAAFHQQKMPLQQGRTIFCLVTRRGISRDADGATVTGSATLEILTE